MTDTLATEILTRLERVEALLREQRAAAARKLPDHPMSPQEVATVLGIHEKTVRRWIGRGKLRATRAGLNLIIRPVDLERMLEGGGAR